MTPRTPLELSPDELTAAVASLKRYSREEMADELGDLPARFLIEFFLKEIGPLAYNRGVKDAEEYFRGKLEDLGATCFEEPMTFWTKRRKT